MCVFANQPFQYVRVVIGALMLSLCNVHFAYGSVPGKNQTLPIAASTTPALPSSMAPVTMSALTVVGGKATEEGSVTAGQFDFGQVNALKTPRLEHTFVLRNDNKAPVVLSRLQPSCGCTSAVLENKAQTLPYTLNPGQTTRIYVSIDPSHLGFASFYKTVSVFVSKQAAPAAELELQGMVASGVSFAPSLLDFGIVPAGVERSLMLMASFDNRLLPPGKLPQLYVPDSAIQITPVVDDLSQKNANYSKGSANHLTTQQYKVTLMQNAHLGHIDGTMSMLVTKVGDGPAVSGLAGVQVKGEVDGDITASPEVIDFGTIKSGIQAKRTVVLTAASPDGLQNLQIVSAYRYISAKVEAGEVDKATKATQEALDARVRICNIRKSTFGTKTAFAYNIRQPRHSCFWLANAGDYYNRERATISHSRISSHPALEQIS